jgi:LacI family transcriptional regulator
VVAGDESPKEDERAIDLLISRRVDGLVLLAHEQLSLEYLQDVMAHTPTIIIGQKIKGFEDYCVTVKNYEAAYQATSYLIQKGHTLIAHTQGPLARLDAVLRRDGYCQALLDAGLEVYPELLFEGDFSEVGGFLAVENLLKVREMIPFTAIFTGNDQTAVGIRLGLYRRNIAVPDDISLIGFDDIPEVQYMIPPLTTMRQPMYHMGYAATQAVFALIDGKQPHAVSFPAELVERETVKANLR